MAFKRLTQVGSNNRQPQLFGQSIPTLLDFFTVSTTLLMMMMVLLSVTKVQCAEDPGIPWRDVPTECHKAFKVEFDKSNAELKAAQARIDKKDLATQSGQIAVIARYIKVTVAAQKELAHLYYDTDKNECWDKVKGQPDKCREPEKDELASAIAKLEETYKNLDYKKQAIPLKVFNHVRGSPGWYIAGSSAAIGFFAGSFFWGGGDPAKPTERPLDSGNVSPSISTTVGKSSLTTILLVSLVILLGGGAFVYFVLLERVGTSSSDDSESQGAETGKTAGKTLSLQKPGGATTGTTPSSTPTTKTFMNSTAKKSPTPSNKSNKDLGKATRK